MERRPAATAPIDSSIFHSGSLVAGRYEIVRFLARGGMGEVYEAFDRFLAEKVALKTILPVIAEEPQALARFRREIQIARRISHRNVCRIHDVGEHTGRDGARATLFLTMELLEGESLAKRLDREQPIQGDEIRTIAIQMAAGLAAAHSENVIHRDLKPANVMLSYGSSGSGATRVVVSDFGLAKAIHQSADLSVLSASHQLIGTPAYMSPEQVMGQELTTASDIYSLGLVLYQVICGFCPFADAGSPIAIAMRRLQQPPPPIRHHALGLNDDWAALIDRCLSREVGKRPQSGDELKQLLASIGPVGAVEASSRPVQLASSFQNAPTFASDPSDIADQGSESIPKPPPLSPARQRRSSAASPDAGIERPVSARRRWIVGAIAVLSVIAGLGLVALRRGVEPTPPPPTVRATIFFTLEDQPSLESKLQHWTGSAIRTAAVSYLRTIDGVRILTEVEQLAIARALRRPTDSRTEQPDLLERVPPPRFLGDLVHVQASIEPGGIGDLVRLHLSANLPGHSKPSLEGAATGDPSRPYDLVARAAESLVEGLGLEPPSPAALSTAMARLPKSPSAVANYSSGLRSVAGNDWTAAERAFKEVTDAEPSFAFALLDLAAAHQALHHDADAESTARTALSLCPRLQGFNRSDCQARGLELTGDSSGAARVLADEAKSRPESIDVGLRLAEVSLSADLVAEARAAISRLRQLPAPLASDPRIELTEAKVLYRQGDFSGLSALSDRLEEDAKQLDAPFLAARASYYRGVALQEQGKLDAASAELERARKIFVDLQESGEVAKVIEVLAAVYHAQGDPTGAERLLRAALDEHLKLGDRLSAAKVENNLGLILREQGRFDDARASLQSALAVFRSESTTFETSACLLELGATAHLQGHLDEAKRLYEEALSGSTMLGDKSGIAIALTNLGEVLYEKADLEGAKKLHEEARALDQQLDDPSSQAYESYRLGLTALSAGDFAAARRELEAAKRIQVDLKETLSVAQTDLALAGLALRSDQSDEAITLATDAETLFRSESEADLAAQASAMLALAEISKGAVPEASAAIDRASKAIDEGAGFRSQCEVCLATAQLSAENRNLLPSSRTCTAKLEARARSSGYLLLALELGLARAQVALVDDKFGEARDGLTAVRKEARERQLTDLERRAAALETTIEKQPES